MSYTGPSVNPLGSENEKTQRIERKYMSPTKDEYLRVENYSKQENIVNTTKKERDIPTIISRSTVDITAEEKKSKFQESEAHFRVNPTKKESSNMLKLQNETKYKACLSASHSIWYEDENLQIGIMKSINQMLKSAAYKVFFGNMSDDRMILIRKFDLVAYDEKGNYI